MTNTAALKVLSVLALLTVTVGCDTGKDVSDEGGTDTEATSEVAETDEPATDGASSNPTDSSTTDDGESSTTGAPEVPCDAEHFAFSRACEGGTQFCASPGEAEYAWGACVATPACIPDPEMQDDCQGCTVGPDGVPFMYDFCGGGEDSTTPLVLNFDGAAVGYATAGRTFDLGRCAATDWPTAATPWLALDRDGSGAIDGGHELFGSATRLRSGSLADNGFAALRELDADNDGRITPADPGFAALTVWSDADGDRRSSGLELQPVSAFGLVAIELTYASDRRCDARGNCEVERAAFTFADDLGRTRTGEVVDVHLACQ